MTSAAPDALAQQGRRTVTAGTVAWLVILAVVALVQLTRRAYIDSAVLITALAVLLVDAMRLGPRPAVRAPTSRWAVAVPAVLVGAVLALAPRHGPVAGAAVAAAGAAAIAYAWPDRTGSPTWDPSTTRTALVWAAAWVAGCLWELAMFLLGGTRSDGRDAFPAASDLLDPLLANPVIKAVFVAGWLAAGVGLLSRADRR